MSLSDRAVLVSTPPLLSKLVSSDQQHPASRQKSCEKIRISNKHLALYLNTNVCISMSDLFMSGKEREQLVLV